MKNRNIFTNINILPLMGIDCKQEDALYKEIGANYQAVIDERFNRERAIRDNRLIFEHDRLEQAHNNFLLDIDNERLKMLITKETELYINEIRRFQVEMEKLVLEARQYALKVDDQELLNQILRHQIAELKSYFESQETKARLDIEYYKRELVIAEVLSLYYDLLYIQRQVEIESEKADYEAKETELRLAIEDVNRQLARADIDSLASDASVYQIRYNSARTRLSHEKAKIAIRILIEKIQKELVSAEVARAEAENARLKLQKAREEEELIEYESRILSKEVDIMEAKASTIQQKVIAANLDVEAAELELLPIRRDALNQEVTVEKEVIPKEFEAMSQVISARIENTELAIEAEQEKTESVEKIKQAEISEIGIRVKEQEFDEDMFYKIKEEWGYLFGSLLEEEKINSEAEQSLYEAKADAEMSGFIDRSWNELAETKAITITAKYSIVEAWQSSQALQQTIYTG